MHTKFVGCAGKKSRRVSCIPITYKYITSSFPDFECMPSTMNYHKEKLNLYTMNLKGNASALYMIGFLSLFTVC